MAMFTAAVALSLFSVPVNLVKAQTIPAQGCRPSNDDAAFNYEGLILGQGGALYQGTNIAYDFKMNVCTDMNNGDCQGLVCQKDLETGTTYNLGYWDASKSPDDGAPAGIWSSINENDGSIGMKLNTENGQATGCIGGINRRLEIRYVCDIEGPELPTSFSIFEDDTCEYTVLFLSQQNCDVGFACHDAPCQNGGICEADADATGADYTCYCDSPHFGNNCEYFNPCVVSDDCQNGATCIPVEPAAGANPTFQCACLDAYSGQYCQTLTLLDEDCDSDPWKGWGVFCLVMLILAVVFAGVRYISQRQAGVGSYDVQRDTGTYQDA